MLTARKTKLTAILTVLFLAIGLISFPAAAAGNDEVVLTVIHMNDTHGRTMAEPYIKGLADELKSAGENVLILDAGDRLHGQTTANLAKGGTIPVIMNAVGYDAMVTGNHDFNYGVERLKELAAMMDFPLLAANVKDENGANLFKAFHR